MKGRRTNVVALLLLAACSAALAATPRDYQERVGVYVWGQLAAGLDAAAEDAKRLGATHAVRVYIGPGRLWDPVDAADNSPLDVKVGRPDYRRFLAAFPVVMLTAYDAASSGSYKNARLDAAAEKATTEEFRRFTLELAKTPGRRIISNWEFENDCPEALWRGCLEYQQARLDGILAGRAEAKHLGYPGVIETAFEFTIVPGFAGRRSGLVEVGAKLRGVDYISYSSWWSLGWNANEGKVKEDFAYLVDMLRDYAAAHGITRKLIIGEFGEYSDLHPEARRLKALADTCLDKGVAYLFNWVLYDQPGRKDEQGRDASHFGKYTLKREFTPQGRAFRRWFPAAQIERRRTKCLTPQRVQ